MDLAFEAIASEGLIAIGALGAVAAFGRHRVGAVAKGRRRSRCSQPSADSYDPRALVLRKRQIKASAVVIDAHEGRRLPVMFFDEQAISGGLDDVGVVRPERSAGVFAFHRDEETIRGTDDRIGFAFESIARGYQNGARLLGIVGS